MGILGVFPFLAWTLYVVLSRANVGQKVARLLSGIALVDSVYLLSVGMAVQAMPNDKSLLHLSFFPLLAFLASLLLQKIAPAT
jgi:hypothetical protein